MNVSNRKSQKVKSKKELHTDERQTVGRTDKGKINLKKDNLGIHEDRKSTQKEQTKAWTYRKKDIQKEGHKERRT